MFSSVTHQLAILIEIGLAVVTVIALVFVSAPYGRHVRGGWGPTIASRTAWIVMESPAVLVFGTFFFLGNNRFQPVPLLLCAIWMLHYVYRSFIYPFQLEVSGKRIPMIIPGLAILFNVLNAYVNAFWIGHFGAYTMEWLVDPRFIVGTLIFFTGRHINIQSDQILRGLRTPGQTGYAIPHGGLYRWVSSPNYFGEMIQWFGWALLTFSPAGLAFALYTTANLAPRAATNHTWYHTTFSEYPKGRKRLIPWVW